MNIFDLKTEHLKCPNAVDRLNPRFSWKIESEKRGVRQISYRIVAKSGNSVLWDSGVVESDSNLVFYDGVPLESRMHVIWNVTVETVDEIGEKEASTSDCAEFFMGLLKKSDWVAKWIDPEEEVDPEKRKPSPYLRKSFVVKKPLKSAVIYQSAHGLYESFINGVRCTDDMFKPGFTSYYYRIQYQRYDVTNVLKVGKNVLSVILADGWWRGFPGKNNFGTRLAYIGQLELTYEDGESEIIGSDESFKYSNGGLRAADFMMGDVFDRNLEEESWKEVGFDDSAWRNASISNEYVSGELIASRGYPVRKKESFVGNEIKDKNGDRVLDFSQNIAGTLKATFRNTTKGQKIVLTFGEDLKNGEFSIDNCCHTTVPLPAFQEITYICKGEDVEGYENEFSFFGFRYVKVDGYDGKIEKGDFVSYAVYSDIPFESDFKCSDKLIEKLVSNSKWSQKGNFLDVATDCPTREKNAWTGDAQIFAPTACYFSDVYPFYEKWLIDQKIEQYESGKLCMTFPSTSSVHNPETLKELLKTSSLAALAGPSGNGNIGDDSVGWGDSAVWIPYIAYMFSGDKTILLNQYETAKRYVDYELSCAKEQNPLYLDKDYNKNSTFGDKDSDYIYDTHFHYGEWNEWKGEPKESQSEALPPNAVEMFVKYVAAKGNPVVATAYIYRSSKNLSEMAEVLGNEEDAKKYSEIAEKIRVLYDKYLISDDGVIEKGRQAPYVRALHMDLAIGEKREKVLDYLLFEIEQNGRKLNTGFLSTSFLLPTLSDNGHKDLAYEILKNKEVPSWLNPIENGATTIPESWDGFKNHRNSLNHYSFGSVCEFLFSHVGGIKPRFYKAGFKEFDIKPIIGEGLNYAEAKVQSPFGRIVSYWEKNGEKIKYRFEIPVNTTANVTLDDGRTMILHSGKYEF